MATHSSVLAWRMPWTEEPRGLQAMGLQRVRHLVGYWLWGRKESDMTEKLSTWHIVTEGRHFADLHAGSWGQVPAGGDR